MIEAPDTHRKSAPVEEISDHIVSFDPETLERLPVRRDDVVARFTAAGNEAAARYVAGIPAPGGVLDPAAVDSLLLTAHAEMQRISEEFRHGTRVAELLRPVLAAVRGAAGETEGSPLRIVDIGCGTGYVVRHLAKYGALGPGVDLLGVDFNPALIGAAQDAAAAEGLACRFAVANAFRLPEPATVFLSSGVLHHFPPADLPGFFAAQAGAGARAFLHFDFQPWLLAAAGSWLFHRLRARSPLSRHDGVASARRVRSGADLVDAARQGAPDLDMSVFGERLGPTPVPRVFYAVVGVRPELRPAFVAALGPRAARLGGWGG
jgi:SAM-dependent methyltransferase